MRVILPALIETALTASRSPLAETRTRPAYRSLQKMGAAMDHPSVPDILAISSEEKASASVIHLAGELDLLSAPLLKEHLMRHIIEGHGRPIIVDCTSLEYMDMKGVRVLEDCHRRAEREGLRFVLVGSRPLIHKIFTVVRLDERIPVLATLADALESLGREE